MVSLFDDNELLQSKKIQGIYVNNPSMLLKKSKDSLSNIVVIVCAQILKTFNDISRKLVAYGVKKRQIIHSNF